MNPKLLRKISSALSAGFLILAVLYFGIYFALRFIHLPPTVIIVGKTGTVQIGTSKMQMNDAPVYVWEGIDRSLNSIYRPLNDFCRIKTGFGLHFLSRNSHGVSFQMSF